MPRKSDNQEADAMTPRDEILVSVTSRNLAQAFRTAAERVGELLINGAVITRVTVKHLPDAWTVTVWGVRG